MSITTSVLQLLATLGSTVKYLRAESVDKRFDGTLCHIGANVVLQRSERLEEECQHCITDQRLRVHPQWELCDHILQHRL